MPASISYNVARVLSWSLLAGALLYAFWPDSQDEKD